MIISILEKYILKKENIIKKSETQQQSTRNQPPTPTVEASKEFLEKYDSKTSGAPTASVCLSFEEWEDIDPLQTNYNIRFR